MEGDTQCGLGLFHHFMELRKYIWPDRYRHAWTELIYEECLKNQITFFLGCASSQKTSHLSELALLHYWCFPQTTCVLISTINMDKLEMAVFGEIKKLWSAGRKKFPWLDGHLIDYKKCIATDDIEEVDARDFRKGIIGRACYVGQKYVGLGVFAGIKQERLIFLCDELQFMAPTFLDCLPNMLSNTNPQIKGGFKVWGSGNPKHDPDDQVGIACEPLDGWSTVENIEKTTIWETKFGTCVNLIGIDSPNFHVPDGCAEPYPRLIGRDFERNIAKIWGKDSPEYEKQVMGRMKLGLAQSRVITRQLCKERKAHDMIVWSGELTTKVYAIDPAYGGGDRCVAGSIEFGKAVDGRIKIKVKMPRVITINLKDPRSPEEQIADAVKADLLAEKIMPNNAFYDSFGKGTIGFAFSKKFGSDCPVPVDSGGRTTPRPVRSDLFIEELDKEGGKRTRLKRCDEHYSKFVTEMWFSVRYTIEAEQLCELPVAVMAEGCSREYYTVAGDKIEVEPKEDMKERLGRSPDLFDWLAIAIEGARQRGFLIKMISEVTAAKDGKKDWLATRAHDYKELLKSKRLTYAGK